MKFLNNCAIVLKCQYIDIIVIKIVIICQIITDKILTYVTYDATMSYDSLAYTIIYLCIIKILIDLFEHIEPDLLH